MFIQIKGHYINMDKVEKIEVNKDRISFYSERIELHFTTSKDFQPGMGYKETMLSTEDLNTLRDYFEQVFIAYVVVK